METAYFTLPGKPQTYKPPRFANNIIYAGHSKTMKPARKTLTTQHRGPPLDGRALKVEAVAYFRRPKKHYTKSGQLKPTAPMFVLKTPDADNCLKFVLDALQPNVVRDDKLAVKVSMEKVWCRSATEEKVEIELTLL